MNTNVSQDNIDCGSTGNIQCFPMGTGPNSSNKISGQTHTDHRHPKTRSVGVVDGRVHLSS